MAYNLRQGGEYKAECGNYHKKAGDDRNCLQCKLFIKHLIVVVLFLSKNKTFSSSDDNNNGEDSVENSLGEDIEKDIIDIWHSSP